MVVIDTSAWIEVLGDGPLRPTLMIFFPEPNELIVPTIVQLELSKWLKRERGEDIADEIIAFTQTCLVEPLDTKIAILAAELCATQKLATADAIIYATALRHGTRLLTCDAHFEGLAGVEYIRKSPQ
jgi:predicted nucleic acid-binding protein